MEKDVFDYIDDDDEEPQSEDRSGLIWNILTILVLLSVVCVGVVFLMIFINPKAVLNPFPPPSTPVRVELDTPTPTPKDVLPPTWTPTNTPVPTVTNTPIPTNTPLPTKEGGEEEPDDEELGDMPVVLHEGSPQYIPATSFYPDYGCKWMGVAGQVQTVTGAPVTGLLIKVGGTLDGELVGNPDILQLTGLAKAYGDAGYEIKLADAPVASEGTLWIQVVDQAGLPISKRSYFDTFDDCQRNMIIIYFKQVQ